MPNQYKQIELDDTYHIRRAAVDFSVPLITDLQVAKVFVDALYEKATRGKKAKEKEIKAWDEY